MHYLWLSASPMFRYTQVSQHIQNGLNHRRVVIDPVELTRAADMPDREIARIRRALFEKSLGLV